MRSLFHIAIIVALLLGLGGGAAAPVVSEATQTAAVDVEEAEGAGGPADHESAVPVVDAPVVEPPSWAFVVPSRTSVRDVAAGRHVPVYLSAGTLLI